MRIKLTSLFAGALIVGISHAASAADIPARPMITKAPPPVVATWTGCYIGINGGYGWANKGTTDPVGPVGLGSHTADGGMFGGQVGCDYQFNRTWVIGVRGMYDWADLTGSNADGILADTIHTNVRSFGTVVGRVGYAFSPNTLLYVLGGVAWVRDRHWGITAGAEVANASVTRTGFDVGVGLEYKFNPSWSIFVEYDYMGFGTRGVTFTDIAGVTFPLDIKQDVSKILVGLNWRFASMGGGRW